MSATSSTAIPFEITNLPWETQQISGPNNDSTIMAITVDQYCFTIEDNSISIVNILEQMLSLHDNFILQGAAVLIHKDTIRNYFAHHAKGYSVNFVQIKSGSSQQTVLQCEKKFEKLVELKCKLTPLFIEQEVLLRRINTLSKKAGSNLVTREELNKMLQNSQHPINFELHFIHNNIQKSINFSYCIETSEFVPAWMDKHYMEKFGKTIQSKEKLEIQKKLLIQLQNTFFAPSVVKDGLYGEVTYKSYFVCKRIPAGLHFEIFDLYGVCAAECDYDMSMVRELKEWHINNSSIQNFTANLLILDIPKDTNLMNSKKRTRIDENLDSTTTAGSSTNEYSGSKKAKSCSSK